MLTLLTIQKLQTEQKKLDEYIVQKKNLADTDSKSSFIRTKIALLVEIGELANELETFKHWKKVKTIAEKDPSDLAKAKEELIDCLHFYLSWANSFEIDFSDYKFQKLVPEPEENELLLAFFSETEKFSVNVPWKILKPKLLEKFKKTWEEMESKLNPNDKDYQNTIEHFRKAKSESKKQTEEMSSSFLSEIEVEKNKVSFYRWLIIFEELAYKLGMKNEEDICKAYLKKNKKNWERQKQNY